MASPDWFCSSARFFGAEISNSFRTCLRRTRRPGLWGPREAIGYRGVEGCIRDQICNIPPAHEIHVTCHVSQDRPPGACIYVLDLRFARLPPEKYGVGEVLGRALTHCQDILKIMRLLGIECRVSQAPLRDGSCVLGTRSFVGCFFLGISLWSLCARVFIFISTIRVSFPVLAATRCP